MEGSFNVEGKAVDGAVETVSVTGELDQATVPQLREALDAAIGTGRAVCVDLTDCRFIDSTGLSLMIETQRRLAEAERGFAICCPAHTEVRKILDLTGIATAIALFPTRDEAVAALSGSAGA